MLTYHLQIEILTPLHIGSGEEIDPYEYVIKAGRLYKINLADFLYHLSPAEQEKFDKISTDIVRLRQFIRNKANFDKFSEFSVEVSNTVESVYETKFQDIHNQLVISPFIRELSSPFIPGSSLKGAMRTAVIFELFQGEANKKMRADIFEAELLKSQRGFYSEKDQRFITRGLDGGKDPFRAIKITDAKLPENTTYIERVETFSRKSGKIEPLNIQILKEITHSSFQNKHVAVIGELRIDDELIKRNREIKLKSINKDFILRACANFTREIIDSELEYFADHPTTEICEQLRNESLDKESFLLRLGWGSGFNSMTVNLKQRKPRSVQTRKLVDNVLPLGWTKVKIIDKN